MKRVLLALAFFGASSLALAQATPAWIPWSSSWTRWDGGNPSALGYSTIQNNGVSTIQRSILNVVNGGCVDNAITSATDCTFAGGGTNIATDTIWTAAGDLVYGTGSHTAVRLAPGTATQVLHGGTTPAWGAVVTNDITAANVTLAKIANAAASSKLVGSGASGSGASYSEITLGTNLSMSGTTLNATGGGGVAFDAISAGTNVSAAMHVGTGSSLDATGSGTVTATAVPVGGISGLGANMGAFLATPSAANFGSTLTGSLASAQGGTGNGFTKFTGPAGSEKTFTLPNATAVILTDNALVTAAQGGTANGFFAVSGPATPTKTFTFPNASATVLTDNALVTAAQGGTANGFFAVSGPAASTKTFTFPNASATVLTSNAAVTVGQGGTGLGSGTDGGVLGFTATGTLASSNLLTANSPVLGGGAGATPKVVAGITTDGTSKLTLGVGGSSVGAVALNNATSGTITIQPVTGALGAVTISAPATTGTMLLTTTQKNHCSITVENPGSAENLPVCYVTGGGTITNVRGVVRGSSPSVTYNVGYGTSIASLTSVTTSPSALTNATTGVDATLNNTGIPTSGWLVFTTSAQSGTVNSITVNVEYTTP